MTGRTRDILGDCEARELSRWRKAMNEVHSTFWTNLATAKQLLRFVWQGRRWWLTPLIVVLLLMSVLAVFLESSAIAPFIYTLF